MVDVPSGDPSERSATSDRSADAKVEGRVLAAIRGVISFSLVWGLLSLASWLFLPPLQGLEEEWVVPWTAVILFSVSAVVGWVEYRRALRE